MSHSFGMSCAIQQRLTAHLCLGRISAAVLGVGILIASAHSCRAQSAPPRSGQPATSGQAPNRATSSTPQSVAASSTKPAGGATYDGLLREAQTLLGAKQLSQAQVAAEKAIKLRPDRYEAHLVAATALRDQRRYGQGIAHLQTALALAPDEIKTEIRRAVTEVRMAGLPADARHQLDALELVLQDAERGGSADERNKYLREFLTRSNAFLENYPYAPELWLLRAQVALELDYIEISESAVHKLKELGVADSDDPSARAVMAQLTRKNWLGGVNYDIAVVNKLTPDQLKYWEQQAQGGAEGNGNWEMQLGLFFEITKNDCQTATSWFTGAAQQGFAFAMRNIAWCYGSSTSGMTKDYAKSVEWLRKAANLGDIVSQGDLGDDYWNGVGVGKDKAEGLRWYRKAASYQYAPAENALAYIYRNGDGVPPDASVALEWYGKAGQHAMATNNTDIENGIAWMYATDPQARYRNGAEAVRLAEHACQLTSYENDYMVDTLAAAYAEIGMWDSAVSTEQKAIDLAKAKKTATPAASGVGNADAIDRVPEYTDRLALFGRHEAYRQPAEPEAVTR